MQGGEELTVPGPVEVRGEDGWEPGRVEQREGKGFWVELERRGREGFRIVRLVQRADLRPVGQEAA